MYGGNLAPTTSFNPIYMGGGDMMPLSMGHQTNLFWLPTMSGVTTATSMLRSTQGFMNLLFHMFPYNEIFKFSTVKSDLIFEIST